ncbi:hypothetical protein FQR65_LT09336 [Abscondita terminalis]|nr:hypothetical protein FQR65_LT09336 [Abscondita terminalis]
MVLKQQRQDQFELIKKMLRICGVSLNANEKLSYKIYSIFVLTLNLYPFFQFVGMHRYLETASEKFEFFIFEAVTMLIFVKAVVLVYKRRFMNDVLYKLQNGIFLPDVNRGGIEEVVLKNKCIRMMNMQAYLYWGVVTVTVIFAVIDSIYSRIASDDYHDWKFEYGRVTMFNTSYSPNYEIASIYQNGSWFTVGWTFAISDLLTVTVLAHITCQLQILQVFIKKIISNCYKEMKKDGLTVHKHKDASQIPYKYLHRFLKQAVEYHLSVFDLAKNIENTFNLLILVIVLSGIVLIGSLVYKLNGLHFGGACCIFFEIVLISYWGNEVSLESQNVIKACYDVKFYGTDLRFQKGLFIMMERSKRPITFTVGKFSPLTLGTFLWQFYQDSYDIEHERIDLVKFNRSVVRRPDFQVLPVNGTNQKGLNASGTFIVTLNRLKIAVTVFRFVANAYRIFPIDVTIDGCDQNKRNIFGLRSILNHTNFVGCPVTKGYYYLKYYVLEQEKFPPHLPLGKYKLYVEVTVNEDYFLGAGNWFGALVAKTKN